MRETRNRSRNVTKFSVWSGVTTSVSYGFWLLLLLVPTFLQACYGLPVASTALVCTLKDSDYEKLICCALATTETYRLYMKHWAKEKCLVIYVISTALGNSKISRRERSLCVPPSGTQSERFAFLGHHISRVHIGWMACTGRTGCLLNGFREMLMHRHF